MHIIKLNAIDSTNSYLKQLSVQHYLENLTVVLAENQTAGRGQRGAEWHVEPGKNLTFSVLVKNVLRDFEEVFNLNVIVAVTLHQAFYNLKLTNLAIKWPNDILSEKKKIAGILIENQIKSDGEIVSIIGIGINVNQSNFENLPQASSFFNLTQKEWDTELILTTFLKLFQHNINKYNSEGAHFFWDYYQKALFRKNIPSVFENLNGVKFMGKIIRVTPHGLLEVELENDTFELFSIKDLKLLY